MIEVFHSLLPTIVPLAGAGITFVLVAGVKKIRAIRLSDNKKWILRPLAAGFSFASVVVVSLITGVDVSPDAVTELVNVFIATGIALVGATGVHELKNG